MGPGARCGATVLMYTVLEVVDMRRPIETNRLLVWGDALKKNDLVKVKRSRKVLQKHFPLFLA